MALTKCRREWGGRGATASAVLMSILKCHVTIRNRCPYRFDSPETGGNNVSTRVTAQCLRAEGLHGITSQHAHNAFIFFQWLVIPASGPFSLIGYVSPLFAARPPSTLSFQPRIMENAASFALLSMDHGRTLIFHKYKKTGFSRDRRVYSVRPIVESFATWNSFHRVFSLMYELSILYAD